MYFKSIELRLLQIAKRTIGEKRGARGGLRSQGRAHHLPPRPLWHPCCHRPWGSRSLLQEEGGICLHWICDRDQAYHLLQLIIVHKAFLHLKTKSVLVLKLVFELMVLKDFQ